MTVRTPDSGFEALESQADRLARVAPYLLLAVPLIPYALSQDPTAGAFGITVAVAVAAAAWLTWMVVQPGWAQRPWPLRIYFAGLIVFIAVLTFRSPWYAFFTWIGFLQAFVLLKGAWRWVVSAAVAVFFAMAQGGGFHKPTVAAVAIWILLTCVDLGLIGAFVLMGTKTEEQNLARKQIIVELAEANQRLEEMIAENTGLQAQLLTQAREAGAWDERQRMAREIHDTLAQGLTGIITQLEAAQQIGSETERERRIGNATRLARDSLAEARRSVQALRPQALEDSKTARGARRRGDSLERHLRRARRGGRDRGPAAAAPRGGGDPAPGGAGGPDQRGQARQGLERLGHPVLHGGRRDPRRPGRRGGVRLPRAGPG